LNEKKWELASYLYSQPKFARLHEKIENRGFKILRANTKKLKTGVLFSRQSE